eukprot:1192860-Prorocentrum_minimum.AAC.4
MSERFKCGRDRLPAPTNKDGAVPSWKTWHVKPLFTSTLVVDKNWQNKPFYIPSWDRVIDQGFRLHNRASCYKILTLKVSRTSTHLPGARGLNYTLHCLAPRQTLESFVDCQRLVG